MELKGYGMGLLGGLSMAAFAMASASEISHPLLFTVQSDATRATTVTAPNDSHSRLPITLNLDALQQGKTLMISGEFGHQWPLSPTQLEHRGENSLSWRGHVIDNDRIISAATLTVEADRIHGRFNTRHGAYRLSGNESSGYWLDRIDLSTRPASHPPAAHSNRSSQATQPVPNERRTEIAPVDDTAVTVDVMAVYTEAAIAEHEDESDLRLALQNALDQANTALSMSQVEHRFRLLGSVHWSHVEDAENMPDSLHEFATSERITQLRNLYSADLMAQFGVFEDYCGIAYVLGEYSIDGDRGFSTNNVSANFPCKDIQVLAHEMGHNLGLHHDPDNSNLPDHMIEPYAHGHMVENEFTSIMAYHPGCGGGVYYNCLPSDYYANPDVDDPVSGLPTGIEEERDTARVLRQTMPYGAQWRQSPVSLADAAGQLPGNYETSGSGLWTAQDKVTFDGDPALISGPVYGDELSRLHIDLSQPAPESIHFAVRSEPGESADGRLTVIADGSTIKTLTAFPDRWQVHELELPEGTGTLDFQWQADARPSLESGLNALFLAGLGEDEIDLPSQNGDWSGSGGCSLNSARPVDGTLSGLLLLALFGLIFSHRKAAHPLSESKR